MSNLKMILGFFLCLVIIISLGFMVISLQKTDEVNSSVDELRDIAENFILPELPNNEDTGKKLNEGEGESSSSLIFDDADLHKSYDFNALEGVNSDIIGWINIPGTSIDYPILKAGEGKDDRYYLKRTFEGKSNSHGSIFIEKNTDSALKDDISLIYGHNMRDGTMFAGLHKYLNMDYLEANKRIYIYTPGQSMQYEIFACMEREDTYITDDYPDVEKMLSYVSKGARNFDKTVDISEGRILALSTCGASGRRILVFAVEQKRLDFLNI